MLWFKIELEMQLGEINNESNRKEQLYITAAKLFSELGYHATSMRDLARALGLQGGSLYAHISSKEELLWAVVNRAADEFDAALTPVLEQPGNWSEKLCAALEAHLLVVARNLDWATVFFHEWKHLSKARLEQIGLRRNKVETIYRQILEQGVQAEEFRPELDTKLAAVLALSSVNWAYQWFQPNGRLSAREVAHTLATMLLEGLAASNTSLKGSGQITHRKQPE